MPLHQVVVRPVQVLVQLDHQRLEEAGELPLGLAWIGALVLVDQPAFHSQLPAGDTSFISLSLLCRETCVRNEDPELPLLLHRPLQSLLDVQPFSHNCRIKLSLKGQQIHVGLRFRHQLAHLLWQDLVGQLLLLLGRLGALTGASGMRGSCGSFGAPTWRTHWAASLPLWKAHHLWHRARPHRALSHARGPLRSIIRGLSWGALWVTWRVSLWRSPIGPGGRAGWTRRPWITSLAWYLPRVRRSYRHRV